MERFEVSSLIIGKKLGPDVAYIKIKIHNYYLLCIRLKERFDITLSMKVLKFEDIDINHVTFDDPMTTYTGGRSVSVKYEGDKLRMFTPKCYLPFGMSSYQNEMMTQPRLSLELSLRGQSQYMKEFTTFFDTFDDHVLYVAEKEAGSWFSKDISGEQIKDIFKKTLKKNKTFPPLLKAKMTTDQNGKYYGDVFDKFKNVTTLDAIKKGVYVQSIVECVGVYFSKKEFGITWKVVQVKVFPPEKLQGYAFCDDEDQEVAEKI